MKTVFIKCSQNDNGQMVCSFSCVFAECWNCNWGVAIREKGDEHIVSRLIPGPDCPGEGEYEVTLKKVEKK